MVIRENYLNTVSVIAWDIWKTSEIATVQKVGMQDVNALYTFKRQLKFQILIIKPHPKVLTK